MREATLTIHLHEAGERGKQGLKILEKIVEQDHPIAVAFGVDNIEAWQNDQKFYDRMRYIIAAHKVAIVQRGHRNRCPHSHTIRDPHHENVCPTILPKGLRNVLNTMMNGTDLQEEIVTQSDFMAGGRRQIEETFQKKPIVYCPPNSLYTHTTLVVARDLGYKHFTLPSALPAWPYKVRDICMVIIPQTSLERYGVGRHAYTHLDHLPELEKKGRLAQHLEQGLMPLAAVKKEPWLVKQAVNRGLLVPANTVLRYGYIHSRDFKRAVDHYALGKN